VARLSTEACPPINALSLKRKYFFDGGLLREKNLLRLPALSSFARDIFSGVVFLIILRQGFPVTYPCVGASGS